MLPTLDYKRVLLAILLVIISIALLIGIIWLIFVRDPVPGQPPPGSVVDPGGILPGTGPGGGAVVVGPGGNLTGGDDIDTGSGDADDNNINPIISDRADGSFTKANSLIDVDVKNIKVSNGGISFLNASDDKFYRMSFDGDNVIELSDEKFPFVEKATWSDNGRKVILEYPDGANIIYDFTQDKKVTLPKGAEDFSFDSDSDKIAYKFIGTSEDDNWLVVSDSNNSSARAVEPIGDQGNKVQVSWSPTNQVVALYHDPVGLTSEEVIFIGLNDENFKSLIVSGSNFKGLWSPDGKKLLYHTVLADNEYNPILWIADADGSSIGNNNFNLGLSSWVDKCVFASETKVYCAVPISLTKGSGLYPELLNDKADVFYEINLNTGISRLIAYPVLSSELDEFQVREVFLNDNMTRLYFFDNFTDQLYYIKL